MSAAGAMDLRYPIGGLFTVLGAILAGYGIVTNGDTAMYQRSTSININLWWGAAMLLFGWLMLGLALRAGRRDGARRAAMTAEGQATEAREKALGLEKP